MSAQWYDLGQRLRAAAAGRPVPRMLHAPLARVPRPVAVQVRLAGGLVEVAAAAPGRPAASAAGAAALDLLGGLGVTLAAEHPATLVVDDPAALGLLHRLALTADPDTDADAAAAHIAWWADRADFPGGTAVADATAACRLRWVLGTDPAAELRPEVWRRWLGLPDGPAGLLDLHAALAAGDPLPLLDVLAEDDAWSYGRAQTDRADGRDWRLPDTPARAAIGLRARCDAADLYAAALLADPLQRRRAVHTGHVVTGTAAAPPAGRRRRVEVHCPRLDSRLRPGNEVIGWTGPPDDPAPDLFKGTVEAAEVAGGSLVLTLAAVTAPAPAAGAAVALAPAPPSAGGLRRSRSTYRALFQNRRSWLTTGRTPVPSRRPVPLDVLVAGAEPDD